MKYVHPFPARMAPEIVLNKLSSLKKGQLVLDPMTGSGMVLNTASRLGLKSYGIDLDPLAVLISKVSSTKVDAEKSKLILKNLIRKAKQKEDKNIKLSWIDKDKNTQQFINYWFDSKQINQLKALSYYLIEKPVCENKTILNVLKVSLSRLIITKEPKASLARDTAHSRPHKTIATNNYDIFEMLPASLEYVLGALNSGEIIYNSKVTRGDARNMNQFSDNFFDAIITSPPYLNAIDYIRGHKFSLVWLGYPISTLRDISTNTIGAEKKISSDVLERYKPLLANLKFDLTPSMIQRYFFDLYEHLSESFRVLKPGGDASYVIGNSNIKGNIIYNNILLKRAAQFVGFEFISESSRELPSYRRYMPINAGDSVISNRMKTEYVISFNKPMK
jgi:DNA modification methylase